NPVKADTVSTTHISRLDEGFITNEVNQDQQNANRQHVKQMQSAAPTSPKEQSLNTTQQVGETQTAGYQALFTGQPEPKDQANDYQTLATSQPTQEEQMAGYQTLPTGRQDTLATFPTSKSNTWSQSLADMPTNTHTVN